MKLNPDCVRDVLLKIEEKSTFDDFVQFPGDFSDLNKYTEDEIAYHINQCEMAGLIYNVSWDLNECCFIQDLTPAGHEFLANIRNDTNWKKILEMAKKVGSVSLPVLTTIAKDFISGMLNKYFLG